MEVTRSKSRDSLLGASGMSCLPCNSAPLCNCTASQTCAATVRTCTECSVAFCQDKVALPAPPSTLGSTIGAALGGVLAIVAGIGLVYWFWWKPRGLAASRQRYSRHLSQRQSKLSMGGIEKRGLGGAQGSVSKRSSVHLRMDGGEESLNRRNTGVSPYLDDGGLSSAGATGDRTADSVDVDVSSPSRVRAWLIVFSRSWTTPLTTTPRSRVSPQGRQTSPFAPPPRPTLSRLRTSRRTRRPSPWPTPSVGLLARWTAVESLS